jgi:glycosyltransferase involved in cell wall biosynthesis
MFSFFKAMQTRKPEYVMLILTKDNAEVVRREALSAGIPANKIFITYASRERLPQFMALCNCSIFFIRNSFSKIASSPTKHAELMCMGIPVICNNIGDTGYVVNATKTGFIVSDFSLNSFENAIDKIEELERIDKEYIRNRTKAIFDLATGVQRYLSLYNRIMARSHQ